MKKILAILVFASLCGCKTVPNYVFDEETYDFDHGVRFNQTKLEEGKYLISVRSDYKTRFNRMSSFIMRQSYMLCGGYDFKLQVKSGISYINERQATPNYQFPDLVANLECPRKSEGETKELASTN